MVIETDSENLLIQDRLALAYHERLNLMSTLLELQLRYWDGDGTIVDRYLTSRLELLDDKLAQTISFYLATSITERLRSIAIGEGRVLSVEFDSFCRLLAAAIGSIALRIERIRSYVPDRISVRVLVVLNGLAATIDGFIGQKNKP